METTIKILRCNVSKAVEQLTEFAHVAFRINPWGKYTTITVTSEKETDISKVREI